MSEFFGDESVIVPDLPAPIVAYRAWTWSAEAQRLRGYGNQDWPTDAPLVAEHFTNNDTNWYGSGRPCVECPSATKEHHQGEGGRPRPVDARQARHRRPGEDQPEGQGVRGVPRHPRRTRPRPATRSPQAAAVPSWLRSVSPPGPSPTRCRSHPASPRRWKHPHPNALPSASPSRPDPIREASRCPLSKAVQRDALKQKESVHER